MIEHLQGREKALEPLGWTGRKAEWIALACLLSGGLFTRAQLCFHLQMNRWQVLRFVQALITTGVAAEDSLQDRQVCRIFSRQIYQALGTEGIRHRRVASMEILLRRLLALDYVLEHPGLAWLPTGSEKVRAVEALGGPVSMRFQSLMPARNVKTTWRVDSQRGPLGIHNAVSTYLPCSVWSAALWQNR